MKYNNRLYELRGSESQKEFAKKLGMTQQNYANYENGKQGMKSDLIALICEKFGCTAEWLLCLDNKPASAISASASKPAYLPLLGRIHAGDAQEPDVIDSKIPVPYEVWERHKDGYLLEVEGNCMSKVYPEGCHILVDPTKPPMNGSIAVVKLNDDDYVMRRMYKGANTLILSPESWEEGYTDIVITQSDETTVELVGTVVWYQPKEEME